jgi:hypothetical protein
MSSDDAKTSAIRPHVDRAGDKGFWCVVARRFSDLWDFIDDRDIDKHATAAVVIAFFLWGTARITEWGLRFADAWMDAAKAGHAIAGAEVGIVCAAVLGPWSLLTGAVLSLVISFYFKARR